MRLEQLRSQESCLGLLPRMAVLKGLQAPSPTGGMRRVVADAPIRAPPGIPPRLRPWTPARPGLRPARAGATGTPTWR